MDVMITAAEAARKASDIAQFVEIVVTEEGFIVRGERADKDDRKRRASADVRWSEFTANPGLLANAVYLVDRALRRQG